MEWNALPPNIKEDNSDKVKNESLQIRISSVLTLENVPGAKNCI